MKPMSIAYEINRAREASEMNAEKAVELPILRQAKHITTNMGRQIARIGTLCLGLTYENQVGKPPSRAQAHVRREADAMLLTVTTNEMTSSPETIAVAARLEPVACMQTSMIGKGALTAASKSPRQKRTVKAKAYASMPFSATVQKMALGTARLAFRTSSDRWTAPSKPFRSSVDWISGII